MKRGLAVVVTDFKVKGLPSLAAIIHVNEFKRFVLLLVDRHVKGGFAIAILKVGVDLVDDEQVCGEMLCVLGVCVEVCE